MVILSKHVAATICLALGCTWASAQLYETPESRKQAAERQGQAKDVQREAQSTQAATQSIEAKEAEALEYVGKTFVYVPDPNAQSRVFFFERMPTSSFSRDPNVQFTPLTMTTFVVTGVVMPPPDLYPAGKDEYLLTIRFPDGKEGYVNVVGPVGLKQHMRTGTAEGLGEYVKLNVSNESPEAIIAKEKAAREKAVNDLRLAKEKAASDLRLAKEKAERERRAAEAKATKDREAKEAQRERDEQARRAAIAAEEARPPPRIGMTKDQVVNGTNWGRPYDINRTITAGGTKEQWVYGSRRYLYFDNGILTAIQD